MESGSQDDALRRAGKHGPRHLARVLRGFVDRAAEGTLIVGDGRSETTVSFHDDTLRIAAVGHRAVLDYELLITSRLDVSEEKIEELRELLASHGERGKVSLEDLLVGADLAPAAEVDAIAREVARDALQDLIIWENAHYEWRAGSPPDALLDPATTAVKIGLGADELLRETLSHIDRWKELRGHVPVATGEVEPIDPPDEDDLQPAGASGIALRIATEPMPIVKLVRLARESGIPTIESIDALHRVAESGAIKLHPRLRHSGPYDAITITGEIGRAELLVDRVVSPLPVVRRLADLHDEIGDEDEAARHHRRAGALALEAGDRETGLEQLIRASLADAADDESHATVIELLRDVGRPDDPVLTLAERLADRDEDRGRHDRSARVWDRLVSRRPDVLMLRLRLIVALLEAESGRARAADEYAKIADKLIEMRAGRPADDPVGEALELDRFAALRRVVALDAEREAARRAQAAMIGARVPTAGRLGVLAVLLITAVTAAVALVRDLGARETIAGLAGELADDLGAGRFDEVHARLDRFADERKASGAARVERVREAVEEVERDVARRWLPILIARGRGEVASAERARVLRGEELLTEAAQDATRLGLEQLATEAGVALERLASMRSRAAEIVERGAGATGPLARQEMLDLYRELIGPLRFTDAAADPRVTVPIRVVSVPPGASVILANDGGGERPVGVTPLELRVGPLTGGAPPTLRVFLLGFEGVARAVDRPLEGPVEFDLVPAGTARAALPFAPAPIPPVVGAGGALALAGSGGELAILDAAGLAPRLIVGSGDPDGAAAVALATDKRGDLVLAFDATGGVAARAIDDGGIAWSVTLGAAAVGPPARLVSDDDADRPDALVVGLADERGSLVALATADGAELWRAELGGPLVGPPVTVGATTFASTREGNLVVLDGTGAVVARTLCRSRPAGAPVTVPLELAQRVGLTGPEEDAHVLLLSERGDLVLYRFDPRRAIPIAEVWATPTGGRLVPGARPSLGARGAMTVLGDGTVLAHDLERGSEVWRRQLGQRTSTATAVAATTAELLVVPTDGARVKVVREAGGATWIRLSTSARVVAAAVVDGAAVLVAEDGGVTRMPLPRP